MENHGVTEILETWHVDPLHLVVNDLHVFREVIVHHLGPVVAVVLVGLVQHRFFRLVLAPLLVHLLIGEEVRVLWSIRSDVIVHHGGLVVILEVSPESTLSADYLREEKSLLT